jgi:transposase InsO family protein
VSHSRAKLNAFGRALLIARIESGWRVRAAAGAVGISRQRAYVLLARFRNEGQAAFVQRSSRPQRSPRRTRLAIERRIARLRRQVPMRGPRAIGWILGLARSTVYAVLRRLGLGHRRLLRPPRPAYRRYERAVPGDLVHIDTKKLPLLVGRGHRFGHRSERHRGGGYVHLHVLEDDRSRVAYCELLASDDANAVAEFLERGIAHFAGLGVHIRQLMSDNALAYVRGNAFATTLARHGIEHVRIPPYTPRWNGKVEAFIRLVLDECVYARPYRHESARGRALQRYLHDYHFSRRHGELGGITPMQRLTQDLVNNVHGQNS